MYVGASVHVGHKNGCSRALSHGYMRNIARVANDSVGRSASTYSGMHVRTILRMREYKRLY